MNNLIYLYLHFCFNYDYERLLLTSSFLMTLIKVHEDPNLRTTR